MRVIPGLIFLSSSSVSFVMGGYNGCTRLGTIPALFTDYGLWAALGSWAGGLGLAFSSLFVCSSPCVALSAQLYLPPCFLKNDCCMLLARDPKVKQQGSPPTLESADQEDRSKGQRDELDKVTRIHWVDEA